MLTIHSLDDIKSLRESQELDCKLANGRDGKGALPNDIWETYSVFANTEGGESDCRNRLLHEMFLLIGLGERAGSGLPKIQQGWTDQGHSLTIHDSLTPYDQTIAELTWGTLEKTTQKTTQKLTEKQQAILDYLRTNPNASRQLLVDKIPDITEDGIKYNLKALQEKGLIKRIGPAKGGHWEIIE